MSGDPCMLTAVETVALLQSGQVSSRELVEAALLRTEQVDAQLNALPTLCAERALDRAGGVSRDAKLAGLPIAVKDLNDVAGVRTTYGSPIYADHVPDRSDLMVERLEQRGAVVVAKSNTPEFGAGGNTFNEVFGETRNPWDTSRTCGGSSGGSAAALASGQVWLATGSDLGGSLRTPAGFCGVVGIRPSPGRVAAGPAPLPFETMSVEGPVGRTVADAALMLDAMSGVDERDPLSLEAPQRPFADAAAAPVLPLRVAYSPDLGVTPVAAEIRDACGRAAERLAAAGVEVEEASPDLTGAPEAFQVLRGAGFVAGMEPLYATDRDRLKPDIIWNIEFGLSLSVERIAQAEQARGAIFQRMSKFMAGYDLLLCPTACVAPFDVSTRWIREVSGVMFDNYVDWLRITSAITLTSCPVVALPCELTDEGLPVGMQLVGRPRGEWRLLAAAAAVEQVFDLAGRVPMDPRGG
ncbi:MAG: amidase [Gaiellales bacterium]